LSIAQAAAFVHNDALNCSHFFALTESELSGGTMETLRHKVSSCHRKGTSSLSSMRRVVGADATILTGLDLS
jgi:hypothetical protein